MQHTTVGFSSPDHQTGVGPAGWKVEIPLVPNLHGTKASFPPISAFNLSEQIPEVGLHPDVVVAGGDGHQPGALQLPRPPLLRLPQPARVRLKPPQPVQGLSLSEEGHQNNLEQVCLLSSVGFHQTVYESTVGRTWRVGDSWW